MANIGFDAVSVERIEKSMKSERFMERVFSVQEREMFAKKESKPRTVAANFAAKEALSKALGCGIFKLEMTEISVLRHESGEPYFAFSGLLKQRLESVHLSAQVSLSHEMGMAFATVLLCEDNEIF